MQVPDSASQMQYSFQESERTQAILFKPTLEVTSNTHLIKHRVYDLRGREIFHIGTHTSNDFSLETLSSDDSFIEMLSHFQAQIVVENGHFTFVCALPDRLYLYYKGEKVTDTGSRVLTHGDIYRVSDEYGSFISFTYKDSAASLQTPLPEILSVALKEPVLKIGRDVSNDVKLSHPQVSAYHACLKLVRPNVYAIVDMGSKNGTFVNNKRVFHRLELEQNDEIRIGPYRFVYKGTELIQHDESSGISIKAEGLIKKVKRTPLHFKRTTLLDDISLRIQPGHLVALVGSSGAGKTTLLDALSGLRPIKKGHVLYNNQDYYSNMAMFSTQLGYVPQEDSLHRALTVEHALFYTAKLRLPSDFKARVKQVLKDVELEEHRKKRISQLSGGQRKRVSIAMELLANPNVFFLDEPTSGLDPWLARKLMWLLRRLADRGCTIIFVTHSISDIDTCDEVGFLADGGHLDFIGPPDEARKKYKKSNLAEAYGVLEAWYNDEKTVKKTMSLMKLMNITQLKPRVQNAENDVSTIATQVLQEPAIQTDVVTTNTVKPRRRGSSFKQFLTLSRRYLELLIHEKGHLAFLIFQAPIIGGILAFLITPTTFNPEQIAQCATDPLSQNNLILSGSCQVIVKQLATAQGRAYAAHQGVSPQDIVQSAIALGSGEKAQYILLILAFAAMMLGCINGCREIVKEWPIYRRERAVNLGIAPYVFSKIIVLGIVCLLESFILIALVQWAAPFEQGIILPPFLEVYITMALISLAGLMTGLFISSISSDSNRALSLLPVVLVPQIIFSGAVFSFVNRQYLQIIGAFFPVRWALAAMGSTVGLHSDKLNMDSFSYQGTLFSIYNKNIATLHLLFCWDMLVVTCVLLGILIFVVLKLKDRRA